jgi:hypothetical protein
VLESTTGEVHDLRLFRLDVGGSGTELELTENTSFDGLVPGGGGSATSPVISADGRFVYVGDDNGYLHAFDAETGEEPFDAIWIGRMLGSPTFDGPDGDRLFVGADNRIVALNASFNGEVFWEEEYDSVAGQFLDPIEVRCPNAEEGWTTVEPIAMIAGIVVATPDRLIVPLTLGYPSPFEVWQKCHDRVKDVAGESDFIWPKHSVLCILDKTNGAVIGQPVLLPDVVETSIMHHIRDSAADSGASAASTSPIWCST